MKFKDIPIKSKIRDELGAVYLKHSSTHVCPIDNRHKSYYVHEEEEFEIIKEVKK